MGLTVGTRSGGIFYGCYYSTYKALCKKHGRWMMLSRLLIPRNELP